MLSFQQNHHIKATVLHVYDGVVEITVSMQRKIHHCNHFGNEIVLRMRGLKLEFLSLLLVINQMFPPVFGNNLYTTQHL